MGINVGIDLGTTYSVVAAVNKKTGEPEVLNNDFGERLTPTAVYIEENGDVCIGQDAKDMLSMSCDRGAVFFKRCMSDDGYSVRIDGKSYNAEDFSYLFLRELKKIIEKTADERIDKAVITVPAYFMDKERTATMRAGKRAGLNVVQIINEPTAAAIAYGLSKSDGGKTVLVYDLGGGTFDVTIAKISQGDITVLGTNGDHSLGGKDWDDVIAEYIIDELEEEEGLDVRNDYDFRNQLLFIAENLKKKLSSAPRARTSVCYGHKKYSVELTEQAFRERSYHLMMTTQYIIDGLLEETGIKKQQIDEVLLVGGSTKMKMIEAYVRESFEIEPSHGVNPDAAVALGAAVKADMYEEVLHIGGSSGRAVLGGIKNISDVTSHSLGMISVSEAEDKYINSVIIKKNTVIPASKTRPFLANTAKGNENETEVYVLQGDFERPLDNQILNKYVIKGIQHTVSGKSRINITYSYDINGIVGVSAKQSETGRSLEVFAEEIPEDMEWTDTDPRQTLALKQKIGIVLAVDTSGSMDGEPTEMVKSAIREFVKKLNPDCMKLSLMAFANEHRVLVKPTNKYSKVLDKLHVLDNPKIGWGNADDPFKAAEELLCKENYDVKYLIVLTDGMWNYPDEAIKRAKKCHSKNIEILALGFGTADHAFLKEIASTDKFAEMTDLTGISGRLMNIAKVIGSGEKGLLKL